MKSCFIRNLFYAEGILIAAEENYHDELVRVDSGVWLKGSLGYISVGGIVFRARWLVEGYTEYVVVVNLYVGNI